MIAIILAAGYGNRMKPLTDDTHKTMLEINNKSIIERIIESLAENKVNKYIVVTGYLAKELERHLLLRFPNIEFEFIENTTYKTTNNIYSLALAFEQCDLNDDVILIESDLIYNPKILKSLFDRKYDGKNVALVSAYETGLDGTVVGLEKNLISNIYPPHIQSENFDLFGKYKTLNIYRLSRVFVDEKFKKLLIFYAKAIDDNCYYELILGVLIFVQREQVYAEIVKTKDWAEVDDPNDLNVAEFKFSDSRLEILENSFGGYWNYDVTDFCFIRNMYYPTNSMIADMKNSFSSLAHNYGSRQQILNYKLSLLLECNSENLCALNGAAQAFPILAKLLKGKNGLIPTPTFGEYERAFKEARTYEDAPGIDLDHIKNQIKIVDYVVFVNPNNPSGTFVETKKILEIAKSNPDKLIIVDESFIEMANAKDMVSHLGSSNIQNIIVIKSLSKSYGVPGLRIGCVYTKNHEFLKLFEDEIPVWNMNSVAEYFLEISIKYKKQFRVSVNQTILDRVEFERELTKISSVKVYKSESQHVLIAVRNDKSRILQNALLNKYGFYIKDVTNKFTSKGLMYFRLAVRLPNENSMLVKAINEVLNNEN